MSERYDAPDADHPLMPALACGLGHLHEGRPGLIGNFGNEIVRENTTKDKERELEHVSTDNCF